MEKMELKGEEIAEEMTKEPILRAGEKEPEEAHWIFNHDKCIKTCSECGSVMKGWAFQTKYFYCPICGVKMNG